MSEMRECKIEDCHELAREHWDNGLSCGDDLYDNHFEKMRAECREQSW